MDIASVLDECLSRLAAGESVASCLARYPAHAQELAPLLGAASEVRVLSQVRLTQGQRLRAKVTLRETQAAQRRTPASFWTRFRIASTAAVLAAVLFVGVAITAVAGSQPGDFGYGVRVVVERAPAWVQVSNEGRASAELTVAERRLQDVSGTADDEVSPVALEALVRGVEAAANRAAGLDEDLRLSMADRVEAQAAKLETLAAAAIDSAEADSLRGAARRVDRAASRLRERYEPVQGPGGPTPTLAAVKAPPTSTATNRPSAISEPRPTAEPASAQRPSATRDKAGVTVVVPTVVTPTLDVPPVEMPTVGAPIIVAPTAVVSTRTSHGIKATPWRARRASTAARLPMRLRPIIAAPTLVIPVTRAPRVVAPTTTAPTMNAPNLTLTPEPKMELLRSLVTPTPAARATPARTHSQALSATTTAPSQFAPIRGNFHSNAYRDAARSAGRRAVPPGETPATESSRPRRFR